MVMFVLTSGQARLLTPVLTQISPFAHDTHPFPAAESRKMTSPSEKKREKTMRSYESKANELVC